MTRRLPDPPLLLITDRATAAGPVEDIVAAALRGGCRWVMIREKDAVGDGLAPGLAARCREAGAVSVINGDIARAARLAAGGVHLQAAAEIGGARAVLGGAALIGVSCHSLPEVEAAERAGADYVTLSPVFLTGSKPGYGPALGLAGLAAAGRATRMPVLALAGIDDGNAGSCREAGAAGIAVMGGVMRATDPESAVRKLIGAFSSGSGTVG